MGRKYWYCPKCGLAGKVYIKTEPKIVNRAGLVEKELAIPRDHKRKSPMCDGKPIEVSKQEAYEKRHSIDKEVNAEHLQPGPNYLPITIIHKDSYQLFRKATKAINKQGTDAIEERARSDLGMVKKNEILFQVIESSPSDTFPPANFAHANSAQ